MLSTIALQDVLANLFKNEQYLCDVYATPDFNLNQDMPVFTILYKEGLDVAQFFYKIHAIYPKVTKFYATSNQCDSILQNTKIIWRKGVWYI